MCEIHVHFVFSLKERMVVVVARILQQHFDFLNKTCVDKHVGNAFHSISAEKSKIVITLDKNVVKIFVKRNLANITLRLV